MLSSSEVGIEFKMEDTQVSSSRHSIRELQIPVPWGHIAVKAWNDPCGQPVICVHGLQDNAGTFDRLIPFLPTSCYYVAVDLPGHGRSSHYPPGSLISFFEYVNTIRRITDHLKWTKFVFMGHSMGGQVGAFFSGLFPEYVTKLILLDAITTPILPKLSILKRQRKLFDSLMAIERKLAVKAAPSYTFEEALSRIVENRPSRLTRDAAEALITRSLLFLPNSDKCRFTTDQRLKDGVRPLMYVNQHLEIVRRISCPILLLLAQETLHYYVEAMEEVQQVVDAYRAKPFFTSRVIEGNHDVHNNSPERVAPYISDFLNSLKCAL